MNALSPVVAFLSKNLQYTAVPSTQPEILNNIERFSKRSSNPILKDIEDLTKILKRKTKKGFSFCVQRRKLSG